MMGGFGKYSRLVSAFGGLIIEFDEVLGGSVNTVN